MKTVTASVTSSAGAVITATLLDGGKVAISQRESYPGAQDVLVTTAKWDGFMLDDSSGCRLGAVDGSETVELWDELAAEFDAAADARLKEMISDAGASDVENANTMARECLTEKASADGSSLLEVITEAAADAKAEREHQRMLNTSER